MTDRRFEDEGVMPEQDEYEVSAEEGEDLDAAMREALEAVEKSEASGEGESAVAPAAVVADLERRLSELEERHKRTLADLENYRKRAARERSELLRYEGFSALADLLPLLDNLSRALEAEGGVEDLKTGVRLIAKQFEDLLQRHGVERIAALGEPFDPRVHNAVSRDEDPEVEVPTVSEELLPGYRMRDRLLRPASVRVSLPPEDVDAEPQAESAN